MKISECVKLYKMSVVADSISPHTGIRITTITGRIQTSILAQLNTHAALSRNAESTRAIPLNVYRKKVLDDPAFPIEWTANGKGMHNDAELSDDAAKHAQRIFHDALAQMCVAHAELAETGSHKQHANRVLGFASWTHVVITATDWDNFFGLRCDPHAQPEFQAFAWAVFAAIAQSSPKITTKHLPFLLPEEFDDESDDETITEKCMHICAARVARVSYAKHGTDGKIDVDNDLALANQLAKNKHASAFEHAAEALQTNARCGKFRGWKSTRHMSSDGMMQTFPINIAEMMVKLDADYRQASVAIKNARDGVNPNE